MKKLYYFITITAALLIAMTSCQKEADKRYLLSVDSPTLNFEASGNEKKIVKVTAENVRWEAGVADEHKDWLKINIAGDEITVTVEDNQDEKSRTGKIEVKSFEKSVSSVEITVNQKAKIVEQEKSLKADKESLSFEAQDNDPETVTVTAENVTWEAEVDNAAEDWLHIDVTDNVITVTVDDNDQYSERTGKILVKSLDPGVASVEIPVTQAELEGTLDIDKTELKFEVFGSEPAIVTVTAENVTWKAEVDKSAQSWLKIAVDGDEISVTVTENGTKNERSGKITVKAENNATLTHEINVVQNTYDLFFTFSTGNYWGDHYENGTGDFDIEFVTYEDEDYWDGIRIDIEFISDITSDKKPELAAAEYVMNDTNEKYSAVSDNCIYEFYEDNGWASEELDIVDGTFVVSRDGNNYIMRCKFTLEDDRSMTGYFKGNILIQGYDDDDD